MSYHLLIDVGNSFCKLIIYNKLKQSQSEQYRVLSEDITEFVANNIKHEISNCFICSVRDKVFNTRIKTLLSKAYNCPVQFFKPANYPLLESAYEPFESLGADRWLAILALHLKGIKNFCIIDCGTAITVDYVVDSVHLGGLISPGLKTFSQCLNHKSDQIQIGPSEPFKPISKNYKATKSYIGTSTKQCIQQSALIYFNLYIDGILAHNHHKYNNSLVHYLIGGDRDQYSNSQAYKIKHHKTLLTDALIQLLN